MRKIIKSVAVLTLMTSVVACGKATTDAGIAKDKGIAEVNTEVSSDDKSESDDKNVEAAKGSIAEQVTVTKDSDMYEAREIDTKITFDESEKKHILDNLSVDTFDDTFEVVDAFWGNSSISGLTLMVKNKLDRPVYICSKTTGYTGDKFTGSHLEYSSHPAIIDAGEVLPVSIGSLSLEYFGKPDTIKVELLREVAGLMFDGLTYKPLSEEDYTFEKGELNSKKLKNGKTKYSCEVNYKLNGLSDADIEGYICGI